jgi:hypothetical protein
MNQCPPGMLCINYSSVIIIILIISIMLFYCYTNKVLNEKKTNYEIELKNNIDNLANKIQITNEKKNEYFEKKINKIEENNFDKDQLNIKHIEQLNPFIEPRKEYPNNMINIKTRGLDSQVQQLGTLSRLEYLDNNKPVGINAEPYILPLYGRRTFNRSTKWNYYTLFNNIKLNISYKDRACMQEHGCEELMNGDIIKIPEINGNFKVNIYENTNMFYIPTI